MVDPIGPEDVIERRAAAMPDRVLEVWNRLIEAEWDGRQSVILQKNAVKALGGRGPHDEWLNIEAFYRRAGWTVVYEKPGYNEEGEASFTFIPGGKKS